MGRLMDAGKMMDKRIRDAGCFTITSHGKLYFYPDGKMPAELYRTLAEDPELRIDLRIFILKQTRIPDGP
jgi:hypothetical protein